MTRCLIMTVTMMLTALAVAMAAPANTYVNRRFGFSVSYPASLKIGPEPENGDGRAFHRRGGGPGEIRAWAGYNALDWTPKQVADEAAESCKGAPAAYRVVRADLVALSCVHDGEVYYQKTLIRNDVLTTLTASYPQADASVWEPIVEQMAGSLKPAH